MKTPSDVYFHEDPNLIVWKPRGTLDEKAVNRIIAFIADEEAKLDTNELRFIDTTAMTSVDLNFRYVFHVALYRRLSRAGRHTIKSAFWVQDEAFTHYFKLHALLAQGSPLQVKLFKEVEDAAKWLGVAVSALQVAE